MRAARLRRDARGLLSRMLAEASIEPVPFTAAHFGAAIEAWLRFGRGRHPGALNFGDCMSYALSRLSGEPLLFVGEDFARTDVAPA